MMASNLRFFVGLSFPGLCLGLAPSEPPQGSDGITLEKIMAHPDWLGSRPENPYWADDGDSLYYERKVEGSEERLLTQSRLDGQLLRHVAEEERGAAGMREIGERFALMDIFLLEMLMASQAMQAAMRELEPEIRGSEDFSYSGQFLTR